MDALENAGRLPAAVYARSILYTTLSPCAMCSGAILLYRIPRIVVGENVTFRGEEDLLRDRGVAVDVLQDTRCIEMMRRFIREHPAIWNEDIEERDSGFRSAHRVNGHHSRRARMCPASWLRQWSGT